MRSRLFFILLIVTIFHLSASSDIALSYSAADVPVGNWSYGAIEKLAVAGLLGLSGLDTKPMTRIQIAHKLKEAIENIEGERIPYYLSLDRDYVIYLQSILYKLINAFREELILIGVTNVQIGSQEEKSKWEENFDFNLIFPIVTEQRFANVQPRSDVLLENENGLRLEDGYNLRTRTYSWMNMFNMLTVSARPALRITENDSEFFLDEGAVKLSLYNLEISIARSAMWWGPGFHGSMLMSNNAKPLDVARVRSINNFKLPWVFSNMGFFGANFFLSRLEEGRAIKSPKFAGLRLEYSPLPYLSLGATRAAIMGGKDRPQLQAEDYWKIFTARSKDEFSTNEVKRTDTDQLASLDAKFIIPLRPEVFIASGLELYGEWAGEDRFSFWENESPGVLIGGFLTDLLKDRGTDLRIEYAKNKPAWYTHGLYNAAGAGTAYTYKGEIMGHHMGGDSDDIFFRISKDIPFLSTPYFDSVRGGVDVDVERHKLTEPVQEKKIEVAADFLWAHSDTFCLSMRYEFEVYRDFNYVAGETSENHIFLLEGNAKF